MKGFVRTFLLSAALGIMPVLTVPSAITSVCIGTLNWVSKFARIAVMPWCCAANAGGAGKRNTWDGRPSVRVILSAIAPGQ